VTAAAVPVLAAAGENAWFLWVTLIPASGLLAALPLALLAAARQRTPAPRALESARRLSLRSFLVGVLAGVSVLLLAAAGAASPLFVTAAVIALAASGVLGFLGLVAEARALGCELRGLAPAAEGTGGASVALGWLVLAGLPLIFGAGLLVLLYLVLRSTGASIIALAGGAEAAPSA
jgi:hypothetical protein